MGSSGCSFPFTISVIEVFLNSLKACNGNLSASSFNSNYTVCCSTQRNPAEIKPCQNISFANFYKQSIRAFNF
uniref:Uncharacterized protein n=1 Tax=Rhizophora mucronata TaxID=61149 RepID=A0A2P2JY14_RHIMU